MPIYEFVCEDCRRVFNFLARDSAAASRRPACPKCGGKKMNRLFSRFATSRRGGERSRAREGEAPGPKAAEPGAPESKADDEFSPEQEARMERAMAELAGDMDSIDENNPRQMAGVMRRLSDATGEPIDDATDEMIRRLEAGEDPDKVEEKMGDVFGDEEPGAGCGGGPSYDGGLYDM